MSGASGMGPEMDRKRCRNWQEPTCSPKKLGFYPVDSERRGVEGI